MSLLSTVVSSFPVLNWTMFASAVTVTVSLMSPGLQSGIDCDVAALLQHHVLFYELAESREFNRDAIRPGFYQIEKIMASLIRLAFCCYTRARVDDSDCGPANSSLACIRDSALNSTAEFLCERTGSNQRCQ